MKLICCYCLKKCEPEISKDSRPNGTVTNWKFIQEDELFPIHKKCSNKFKKDLEGFNYNDNEYIEIQDSVYHTFKKPQHELKFW